MSKSKLNKSLINVDTPKSLNKAISNLTDEPTKVIGKTIADCLFLVFGGISQWAEKKRIKYARDLEMFKEELEQKVKEIPEEDFVEPSIHTVCTALENMRFCVEEQELRKMFASLIASAADKQKVKDVHPSFGEIIKQLTAEDAQILLWMKEQVVLPIISFHVNNKGKYEYIDVKEIFLANDFDVENETLQLSLENLSRLKIINMHRERGYSDKQLYETIKQQKLYLYTKRNLEEKVSEEQSLNVVYGSIEITVFGQKFIGTCC